MMAISFFRTRRPSIVFWSYGMMCLMTASIWSCTDAPILTPNGIDVPPQVKMIQQQSSVFQQDEEHMLLVDVGRIISDDLSHLDGCWGGFGAAGQWQDNPFDDIVEFQHFDLNEGTLVTMIYSRNRFGFDTVFIGEYEVEITAADTIRLQPRRIEFRAAIFAPEAVILAEDDLVDDPPIDLRIIVSGDQFVIADELDADAYVTSELRMFRRMECVSSDAQTKELVP